MTRTCCCADVGRTMCSVHWLAHLRRFSSSHGKVFTITKAVFAKRIKELAEEVGLTNSESYGTHALRRGMAQDVLDMGGSLAALLNAGDWASSAYLKYLRSSQGEDVAVAKAAVYLSESDDDM